MKRFKFFQAAALLLLFTAGITLNACCDDNEPPGNDNPPPVIQLADESLQQQSFAPDKLTGSFSFEATAAWTATVVETTGRSEQSTGPEWITLSQYSGEAGEQTITITLTPNDTGSERSADIIIASEGQELRISVTQAGTADDGQDEEEEIIADTGEWDWVEYTVLNIMDDGTDHNITGDHYVYFKEPGYFQPGKTNGEEPHLKDMGAMSWKEFSIMPEPEVDYSDGWSLELIPCIKGHGYFSALNDYDYQGSGIPQHVRFWVEDYIMQGDEIVGAKLRCTAYSYPNLLFVEKDGTPYRFYSNSGGLIVFKSPRSVIGKCETALSSNSFTFVTDGGKMEYDEWERIIKAETDRKESEIPVFNETNWAYNTEIFCTKGHGYFIRQFTFNKETGEMYTPPPATGFYVRDYLIENNKIIGLVLDYGIASVMDATGIWIDQETWPNLPEIPILDEQ